MSTPVLGSLLVLSLSSLQKLTYKWIKEREKEMKYDRHTLHFALSTSYSLKKVPWDFAKLLKQCGVVWCGVMYLHKLTLSIRTNTAAGVISLLHAQEAEESTKTLPFITLTWPTFASSLFLSFILIFCPFTLGFFSLVGGFPWSHKSFSMTSLLRVSLMVRESKIVFFIRM